MSPSFPLQIFSKDGAIKPISLVFAARFIGRFIFNRISAIQNNPSAGIASERSKKRPQRDRLTEGKSPIGTG